MQLNIRDSILQVGICNLLDTLEAQLNSSATCSDLLRDVCRENKQKRQVAMGEMPTYRIRKPMRKAGEKHGWAAGWYRQYCDFSWKARRVGPAW